MNFKIGDKVKIEFTDTGGSTVFSCEGVIVVDKDGELSVKSKYRLDKIIHIDKITKLPKK